MFTPPFLVGVTIHRQFGYYKIYRPQNFSARGPSPLCPSTLNTSLAAGVRFEYYQIEILFINSIIILIDYNSVDVVRNDSKRAASFSLT